MNACVLGEIDLVRALALGGISSVVMARSGSPSRHSRSTVALLEWADSRAEPGVRVERLLAYAEDQPEPPPLFYDADWDLLLISRARARLARSLRFVIADPELVEDLVDKERFQALAADLGLPVPESRRVTADGAAVDVDGLRFPTIVKPLTRHQGSWATISRAKAVRVPDVEALQRLREQLVDAGVDVLVQELVEGPETRIESYHVYVDDDRNVAAEFTGRKLRTYPAGYGYTTALEITSAEDVRTLGGDIVGRLGLTGVAKLDFKRDDAGALHLLEVNPRFNLWHHPGALAGVNIPALVYADLTGVRRPTATAARPGVRWCSAAHDLKAARLVGWSIPRWGSWFAGCEAKSGFALADPLPLPRALVERRRQREA